MNVCRDKKKNKTRATESHTEECYKLAYCQRHITKLQMKVCEEYFDYYQKFFTREPNLGFFQVIAYLGDTCIALR